MTPPPRCEQTNKVKLLPSRRTTYAGGKKALQRSLSRNTDKFRNRYVTSVELNYPNQLARLICSLMHNASLMEFFINCPQYKNANIVLVLQIRNQLVTARVRSTAGGYVFSLSTMAGGGTPR